MGDQTLTVCAESVPEARELIRARVPEGFQIVSEDVLSKSGRKTVTSMGKTVEVAVEQARAKVPAHCTVLGIEVVSNLGDAVVSAEAFSEDEARAIIKKELRPGAQLRSVQVVVASSRGLLGIGRTKGQYDGHVFQRAVVKLTYAIPARIAVQIWKPGRTPVISKLPEHRRNVALALVKWYREEAVKWWKSSGRESAICDDGNEEIKYGEGYLRPGYLCCEHCTDHYFSFVDWEKALPDMRRWFGPQVPQPIQDLVREIAGG